MLVWLAEITQHNDSKVIVGVMVLVNDVELLIEEEVGGGTETLLSELTVIVGLVKCSAS